MESAYGLGLCVRGVGSWAKARRCDRCPPADQSIYPYVQSYLKTPRAQVSIILFSSLQAEPVFETIECVNYCLEPQARFGAIVAIALALFL